ncbi:YggT family protein [Gardnerella leopoldii]|uniref:YggT family protein n=2 Tax=Gardnerella TaxID=2701 RepID=UPI003970886A
MIFVALSILRVIIRAYLIIMIIRMVADWLFVLVPRMRPRGVFNFLIRIIYFTTEPPLRVLRKFIPPTRCGNISIDVSYMLLYFALYVLQIWL